MLIPNTVLIRIKSERNCSFNVVDVDLFISYVSGFAETKQVKHFNTPKIIFNSNFSNNYISPMIQAVNATFSGTYGTSFRYRGTGNYWFRVTIGFVLVD